MFWPFERSGTTASRNLHARAPHSSNAFQVLISKCLLLPLERFLPPTVLAGVSPSPPSDSTWAPLWLRHPNVDTVSTEVDSYFLKHWEFPSEKAKRDSVEAGFSIATCLYFPLSKDDMVGFAYRLLTVLFLIDGITISSIIGGRSADRISQTFWRMSFADGEAYNEKLIPISCGDILPYRRFKGSLNG
jgi:hypothetical protein